MRYKVIQIQKQDNNIIKMPISFTNLRYYLTTLRTGTPYLIFQSLQLLLSLTIVILAFLSDDLFRESAVLWMEFVLLLLMCFDLFVVRMCTEGGLWKRNNRKFKRNVFDTCIIAIFAITFAIMCFTENKYSQDEQSQYKVLIETDDIVLITIIVVRYAVQIYQIVKTIRNTRKNMEYNRKMKDIDLNKTPNSSIIEQKNDIMQDEILRRKLEEREKYRSAEKQREKRQPNLDGDMAGNRTKNERQLQMQ